MEKNSQLTKVLEYQGVGFVAIIALTWLNELLGLPSLIFRNQLFIADFRQSALEMLLILGVWLLVSGSTRRLLRRVRHLEAFMRVCAWCHRIDYQGQWVPLEEFLQQGYQAQTTHGICGDCLHKKQAEALEGGRKAPQVASTQTQAGSAPV